jgi:CRP/FNR family transcriptional regulator, cyclic AMP receptor protein
LDNERMDDGDVVGQMSSASVLTTGGRQLSNWLCHEETESPDVEEWRLKTTERSAVATNSWFAGLSSDIRHDLLRALRVRSCEPGENLFSAGDPVHAWMVCLAGAVRVGTSFATGRSLTLRFLRPGHWFGDLPLTSGACHTHDASAHGRARIGEVPREAVSSLMGKHPAFQAALYEWQSMRLALVFGALEDHATMGVYARLARQLHRLAKDHGMARHDGQVRIGLSLAQGDLANLVGCTRQSVNYRIGVLTKQGLIRNEQGSLIVTDLGALEKLAEDAETW